MKEIDKYIRDEGLDKLIDFDKEWVQEELYDAVNGTFQHPFPPDKNDLVEIHQQIRDHKRTTVLEFGVGFSTLVIADALMKNKRDYEASGSPPLRNRHQFKVFSIDSDDDWIFSTISMCPKHLLPYISIKFSKCDLINRDFSSFSVYRDNWDIVPDYIYLDGPHPKDILGSFCGLSFQCDERTVMAGDILLYENTLIPGCIIRVDGRSNNVRFLLNSFSRDWMAYEICDATTLFLKERGLGKINTFWWETDDEYSFHTSEGW